MVLKSSLPYSHQNRPIPYLRQCSQTLNLLSFKSQQINGKYHRSECVKFHSAPYLHGRLIPKQLSKWSNWPWNMSVVCRHYWKGVNSDPTKGNQKFLVEGKKVGRGPVSLNNSGTKSRSGVVPLLYLSNYKTNKQNRKHQTKSNSFPPLT